MLTWDRSERGDGRGALRCEVMRGCGLPRLGVRQRLSPRLSNGFDQPREGAKQGLSCGAAGRVKVPGTGAGAYEGQTAAPVGCVAGSERETARRPLDRRRGRIGFVRAIYVGTATHSRE